MTLDFLPRKKTYIIGGIMIAYGALSGLVPELFDMVNMLPSADPQRAVMEGLLVITGRKAISRLET